MAAERSGPGEERCTAGEQDLDAAAARAEDRLGLGRLGPCPGRPDGGRELLFLIQWRVAGPAAASGGARASRSAGEGDAARAGTQEWEPGRPGVPKHASRPAVGPTSGM